jgi:hypothetical protein
VPEAVEMTACGKPCGLPTSLGNRCCDSHISTAQRLLHSLSNQSRKEQSLSHPPYLFSRLILRLENTFRASYERAPGKIWNFKPTVE